MNPGNETPQPNEAFSASEVERLLEEVASAEQGDTANASKEAKELVKDGVESYDFRNPMVLSAQELRKLKQHQEEFTRALASRLSQHLRLEFSLELTQLQTVSYQKLAGSWANPSHLALFKLEPLPGVCVLETPPRLGVGIVDRLMGGSGQTPEALLEMSEIEKALLEQAVQLILSEWCHHWTKFKDLKPVLLGYENNGRFIQGIPSETTMLVVGMQARLGECTEQIQIGIPYAGLEPLIRQLAPSVEPANAPAARTPAAAATTCKWNPCLDEVCIPVSAKWQGFELAARDLLALKVGDVLQINAQMAEQVNVRLADLPKFNGRLGVVAGKWAVELTQTVKR